MSPLDCTHDSMHSKQRRPTCINSTLFACLVCISNAQSVCTSIHARALLRDLDHLWLFCDLCKDTRAFCGM
ncbi:hypothetical protein ABKV19_017071 [Rosa sericea]